jgi:prolyl 4-hydroxylase
VRLQVETISLSPRAFIVENFLSDFEADAIVAAARPHIEQSYVGQSDSGGVITSVTRTSSNTWLTRSSSPLVDSIYRRIGDISGIEEAALWEDQNAESMQVVHYAQGQTYNAHFDWGVRGYPESRFLTVLLYLSDQLHSEAGGETAFPKGGADGRGMMITPKKGNAVMFYSLLPDGNADDMSLHAALPVEEGEKWLANVWIWDPKVADSIRKK